MLLISQSRKAIPGGSLLPRFPPSWDVGSSESLPCGICILVCLETWIVIAICDHFAAKALVIYSSGHTRLLRRDSRVVSPIEIQCTRAQCAHDPSHPRLPHPQLPQTMIFLRNVFDLYSDRSWMLFPLGNLASRIWAAKCQNS